MVSNVRMKVAAGATVLGLGGLAGFALGSNDGQPAAAGLATAEEPNVQTEVVHRTIHVRAKEGTAGLVPSTGTSDGGSLSSDESGDDVEQESDDAEQESDDDD